MPSIAECLCCHEVTELGWKLQDLTCITQHENFLAVCLNEDVLRTAVVLMTDWRRDLIREPLTSRPVAPRRTWTGLPMKYLILTIFTQAATTNCEQAVFLLGAQEVVSHSLTFTPPSCRKGRIVW